jgi:hypothetical protein
MAPLVTRCEVYAVIEEERRYQDGLRTAGKFETKVHSIGEELVMMDEYLARAKTAYADNAGDEAALHVVRKIAALGARCMEHHGAFPRPCDESHCEDDLEPADWAKVLKALDSEREYQDAKWGPVGRPEHDEQHKLGEWLLYIEKHLEAAKDHIYYFRAVNTMAEVRKVVALCVACMEFRGAPAR